MSLSQWNPTHIEFILDQTGQVELLPPIANRAAWEARARALGPERVQAIMQEAEKALAAPIPALTANLYLDFQRTGDRKSYETPYFDRRAMLIYLTIAEALENKGRFLNKCLDVAWAITEEASWCLPAHESRLADTDDPMVDLFASETAFALAEFDAILGQELDPYLSKRIRDEAEERIITPYLTRHDYPWMFNVPGTQVNNWNAVCNCSCMGAAMYLLNDNARLAEVLARGLRSLDDFLAGFGQDGGCSEGPGYWNYGFGHYVVIADLVERRTKRAIPMFDADKVRAIAQFPLRTRLADNEYASFSDCPTVVSLSPALLMLLGKRLDIPRLELMAAHEPDLGLSRKMQYALLETEWLPKSQDAAQPLVLDKHNWFGDMAWMIARLDPTDPEAMVLACKGGHNGEFHNQNDVGSFIVNVGGESLISDIGSGRYTRQYFGPERYTYWVVSSKAHSVPLPNGIAQSINEQDTVHLADKLEHDDPGKDMAAAGKLGQHVVPNPNKVNGVGYASTVLEHVETDKEDRLTLDMTQVYNEDADLERLQRSTALLRTVPGGCVTVTDTYRFKSGAHPFENAIITLVKPELTADAVVLRGEKAALRITWQGAESVDVELHSGVQMQHGPNLDVYRIAFRAPEQQEGEIKLVVERA